jgi:hypothetical protein
MRNLILPLSRPRESSFDHEPMFPMVERKARDQDSQPKARDNDPKAINAIKNATKLM